MLEQLDPASLSAAIRVCRAWAPAGIRVLWSAPPSDALGKVSADRRHIYTPAIRTLRLTRDTMSDSQGCRFPQLRSLDVYYSVIADPVAFSKLLDSCSALLHTVTISAQQTFMPAMPPKRSATGADATTDTTDCDDYSGQLHPSVLLRLAQCAALAELHMHNFIITPAAIERVRAEAASTPAPPPLFPRLLRLDARVSAPDAPALLALCPPQRLVDLELIVVASGPRAPVLQALSRSLPCLQQLLLWFASDTSIRREQSAGPANASAAAAAAGSAIAAYAATARAADAAAIAATAAAATYHDSADDFTPLHDLPHMRSLSILGTDFCMSGVAWRTFLLGLPRLEHLHIGLPCRLPPNAFMIAGACCRRLRHLELYMRGSFSAEALATAAASVGDSELTLGAHSSKSTSVGTNGDRADDAPTTLFPELRVLRLFPPVRHFCGNA